MARQHHISHGTLGIVAALTAVGRETDRPDLLELAVAGAEDVVARDEQGPAGFLVPHSDPPDRPELIDRYNFGWCQGPTGDAQVFRLLRDRLGGSRWSDLTDRCWHTVTHCGLPQRRWPGFWDNNGHCCGTAGVLALACDRAVERDDGQDFAEVLVADLADRATVDADGTRWSNVEHRATPSVLEPRLGWAMGAAGIVARAAALRPARHGPRPVVRRHLARPPAGSSGSALARQVLAPLPVADLLLVVEGVGLDHHVVAVRADVDPQRRDDPDLDARAR